MNPTTSNLFLRLHKWASRQDENFLTESLAVVLEHLLARVPAVGTRLVRQFTGGLIDVPTTDASTIEIHTQVESARGRPDLEFRSLRARVVLEVKVESGLRTGQLEGYRVYLAESGIEQTRLVLLTRYPESFGPEAATPDLTIRWFEVADWLESEFPAIIEADEIATFVV